MSKCAVADCSGSSASKLCAGCKVVSYCDRKCQTQHWPLHKDACQTVRIPRELTGAVIGLLTGTLTGNAISAERKEDEVLLFIFPSKTALLRVIHKAQKAIDQQPPPKPRRWQVAPMELERADLPTVQYMPQSCLQDMQRAGDKPSAFRLPFQPIPAGHILITVASRLPAPSIGFDFWSCSHGQRPPASKGIR